MKYSGPDHALGDPVPRRQKCGCDKDVARAVLAVFFSFLACGGHERFGKHDWCTFDRKLRDDRGRAPDGLYPAATAHTQKPRAIGVAAGPNVRVAHEAVDRIIEGTGEVVISGSNVTPGYDGNPEGNAKSFIEAEGPCWLRTGDQGAFDDEG